MTETIIAKANELLSTAKELAHQHAVSESAALTALDMAGANERFEMVRGFVDKHILNAHVVDTELSPELTASLKASRASRSKKKPANTVAKP